MRLVNALLPLLLAAFLDDLVDLCCNELAQVFDLLGILTGQVA